MVFGKLRTKTTKVVSSPPKETLLESRPAIPLADLKLENDKFFVTYSGGLLAEGGLKGPINPEVLNYLADCLKYLNIEKINHLLGNAELITKEELNSALKNSKGLKFVS